MSSSSLAAYIHVPFCKQLCAYCDFNKVFLEGQPVDTYVDLLLREMKLTVEKFPQASIKTIYIGGGTPTVLSVQQLERLLKGIHRVLSFSKGIEFTMEANPGDFTLEKLAVIKEYGVNRVSLGVQTFDEQLLRKIGRSHTREEAIQTIELLKKSGVENLSLDLMIGLPGQTFARWEETLALALSFDLPHYSLYSLILEEHTLFMNCVRQGKIDLPDEELVADFFEQSVEKLAAKGLQQYEISNFAKVGFQSQHNLAYWKNEQYFGFGAGASGYLGKIRYRNHGPIQHYLEKLRKFELPIVSREELSVENQMEEELFLGLRKLQGVSKRRFSEKFGRRFSEVYGEVVRRLVEKGWLCEDEKRVWLSESGRMLGNLVFEEFLL